ncbi:FkbM family methyltransferase [Flavobacterium azooxidireducens]|uniref:FkbM family methyltransferase n=1 Tax=Flavobacterium azooxidireducens TaxID=1871076 RepID=A0ABY4KD46_9FLAO|nr:FkbM family methyltransferase [Flavobacterium azooxidireducens]UPQ78464.1 FkbM family methyltransferase [Flavobacterium azooxidireducens]
MSRFKQYRRQFGIIKGIEIYLKLKLGIVSSLKVPGIKYPIKLRPGTSDIRTFYQVFVKKEYDIDFNLIPKVIIDGGSNVGLFAVLMKNRYPEAKIICIEPDPENFELLKTNISCYNDIFCENSGLWNKDTKLKVYDKYNSGKWGLVVEEDIEKGSISAISMDTLFEKYSLNEVDVVKIDIETSERQLFSTNFEKWLPKNKIVLIELHDWIDEGCSEPFFKAINKSFSSYHYSTNGENVIIRNKSLV